jgi:cobalt-zinc-cadmium efflux system membrane fusion protein
VNFLLAMRSTSGQSIKACGALMVLALFLDLGTIAGAFAHGESIEVGGGARGPVRLSEAQRAALAVQTTPAGTRPLATLLKINGEVQLLPDRQAHVSIRISGQIKGLSAKLGDTVRTGQNLALVQSRLVGDPPATVAVTAPIDGVVDARNVVLGQAVEPNTELFQLSDRSQMNVIGKVYEEDLGKVKLGQEARIRLLAYPEEALTGKVTLIEPNLDPASRTVKVWIQLPNPQGLLKPNMFATVSVVLRSNDAALTIPNGAIIEANGEKFVFVRDGDTFNRIEVTIGASDDQSSEITDGLVPGDEVVTQGNRQIYTLWLTGGSTKPKG